MASLKRTRLAALVACAVFATAALAKAPPSEVAKLGLKGTPLTPVGAERAGSKDGAIGELVDDGEGVADVAEGFPFPILDADPTKAGMEAIWNHKLKFKGVSFARWNNQAIPTESGQYTLIRFREEGLGIYYKPGNTLKDINNILLYFFEDVVSPPRLAGQVLLVHETLDSKKEPRQAWIY